MEVLCWIEDRGGCTKYNVLSTKRGEFRGEKREIKISEVRSRISEEFPNSTQIKKWPVLLSRGCTAGPLDMELLALLVTAKDARGTGILEKNFERQVI